MQFIQFTFIFTSHTRQKLVKSSSIVDMLEFDLIWFGEWWFVFWREPFLFENGYLSHLRLCVRTVRPFYMFFVYPLVTPQSKKKRPKRVKENSSRLFLLLFQLSTNFHWLRSSFSSRVLPYFLAEMDRALIKVGITQYYQQVNRTIEGAFYELWIKENSTSWLPFVQMVPFEFWAVKKLNTFSFPTVYL